MKTGKMWWTDRTMYLETRKVSVVAALELQTWQIPGGQTWQREYLLWGRKWSRLKAVKPFSSASIGVGILQFKLTVNVHAAADVLWSFGFCFKVLKDDESYPPTRIRVWSFKTNVDPDKVRSLIPNKKLL